MTTKEIIRCYAWSQPGLSFSRKGLLSWVQEMGLSESITDSAISLSINRMLQCGELVKKAWGQYSVKERSKRPFFPIPNDVIKRIYQLLKDEFPYTNMCVWDPRIIVPFMQHIPNIQLLIAEVERVAMEPAFNLLQANVPNLRVIFNPSSVDYAHYVSGYPSIVVKPLISQAPMFHWGGILMPSLEKIMVDIISDVEFTFAQGAELNTIYDTVMSSYEVNNKALFRYADRRGRRGEVERLIKVSGL